MKSWKELIKGCPDLSHLALRGYGVADKKANILLKVFLFQSFACILQNFIVAYVALIVTFLDSGRCGEM